MLDFEYGVNTGNRFLQFVDHEEEPDEFIAAQTKTDEPTTKKSSTKDSKTTTTTTKTKKVTTTTTTTTTKTNKENLTSKSNNERRATPSAGTTVFSDNQNQSTRPDSSRGTRGAAGSMRRGTFDGNRGGGARSQRFQKFDGQPSSTTTFDEQSGRGRGGPSRRGLNRGGAPTGGRGGRPAYLNNRTSDDGQTTREQLPVDSNFDANDQDVSPQDRSFEPDTNRRNYRGNYRPRPQHTHRDGNEMSQEDQRANRRLNDRQPRNNVSGVKPIEKKDGEGAHNWGNPTENPDDHMVTEETAETAGQIASWAQQVDEAEKQMTLDEYKKQMEVKKRAQQEKLPQFKTRTAGEGEDPKGWQKPAQVYRKKTNADQSDDEEEEEEEEIDEDEDVEEEEEQMVGKKKLINIPLHFKPIATGRGGSARGGRRGGNPRYRERTEQTATSPEQGATGDESQRAAPAPSTGGNYRRPYGNAARSSRSGRNQGDSNALALDNPEDFPTLPKQ